MHWDYAEQMAKVFPFCLLFAFKLVTAGFPSAVSFRNTFVLSLKALLSFA